ncbi:hypothetical protein [Acidovorax sp. sic0104]|uniref:hypothetical protein n=1 Tax=Acidovorax sp. sic0104 TaxID=2854784 RepID=UPI001C43E408|nr:hypothetical protein [Acidovorax sp. sic0104]MBV7542675.1 hypothetical protein [Acidovorax sp. sic0104]
MFEVTSGILAIARAELSAGRPSIALRAIARRFQLGQTDVAWVAAEAFENIATPEIQAIWNWDLSAVGKGHSDDELDGLLSHLVVRQQ